MQLQGCFATDGREKVTFQKGQGGRRRGARHRISTALLEAIAKDFEEFGEETVRITRVVRPVEYLRIVASLLPRELEITVGPLQEISDQELELLIDRAREQHRLINVTPNVGGREEETADRAGSHRHCQYGPLSAPQPQRLTAALSCQPTAPNISSRLQGKSFRLSRPRPAPGTSRLRR